MSIYSERKYTCFHVLKLSFIISQIFEGKCEMSGLSESTRRICVSVFITSDAVGLRLVVSLHVSSLATCSSKLIQWEAEILKKKKIIWDEKNS